MVTSIPNDYTSPNSASAIQAAQQNEAVQKAEEMAAIAEEKVETIPKTGIVLQHNTDRVKISPQGKQAAQQAQEPDSEIAQQTTAQAQATAQAATSKASTTKDATESSSSNTNLTSLSEQEITTLVQQGSVTQAQADKELARRTAQQSESSKTPDIAANNVEE